ncbi:hypothetical protein AX774_g4933 [Zancudomyces culisetae]|uniref:Uncharacterized protein n=1 Tax=Zancudomyces culisetae TaxID=1213189 RepID=A0A1R1PKZ8_ZANCU|nr:hypothetical protein AX774_g4933 [Zancudomyces culisetae]|eukprot:OMH81609.1 hypothetical protein AX774_g4933 [Zancudomyces culisetae]
MIFKSLTTALFITSTFAAGADIENTQKTEPNSYAGIEANNNLRAVNLDIRTFKYNFYKGKPGRLVIEPNGCYNLASIRSAIIGGGRAGVGSIMFCTQKNCLGKCRVGMINRFYRPDNLQRDIGGLANSVLWFNPALA